MKEENTTAGKENPRASTSSNGLGLVIPHQSPAPTDCMLLEPRDTSQWIAALPLANIGETARQVYTALLDFNRYEIPDLIRAKVVELFRPTVEYVCHNLRRHYVDIGFPLSKKAWKTVVLARELNSELATAYKIIVERMLTEQSERFDRKLLVISLHHVLHYLGQVYLQTTLAYTTPPASLWKQVNAIFAFAKQNQIHRVPVKMKQEDTEQVSTIEELFKALLLFAATVPSRLRQSHLENTFEKTREWAMHANFLSMDDDIPSTGAININLGSNEGPVHNALRMPIAGRNIAILDLRSLIRKLHDEYEQAPLDGAGTLPPPGRHIISRALLRQLIRNWHTPAERQFVRTRLHFSLHVQAGLRAIHATLTAPATEAAPPPGDAPLTGVSASPNINVPGIGDQQRVDPLSVIDDTQLSLAPSELSHQGEDPALTESQLTAGQHTSTHWDDNQILDPLEPRGLEVTTLNESAGGYCIPWSADAHPPKVKVGELLGIGGADKGKDYGVGVVRWLHCLSHDQLELGLQILSSQVKAMNAQPIPSGKKKVPNKRTEPLPCLVLDLHDTPREHHEPSIVLSSASHPVGTQLVLDGLPKPKQRVRITRLIDFSSGFARFGIEFPDQEQEDEQDAKPGYTEFDSLWNTL